MVLLQQNDISQIFSRIKDRVKFVDQRTKLISNLNEQNENGNATTNNLFDLISSSFKPVDSLKENGISGSSVSNEKEQRNDGIDTITDVNLSTDISTDGGSSDHLIETRLPSDYEGPKLTMRMQQYIDENNISKFNPHTNMRAELLTLIFDDVTKSHKLL